MEITDTETNIQINQKSSSNDGLNFPSSQHSIGKDDSTFPSTKHNEMTIAERQCVPQARKEKASDKIQRSRKQLIQILQVDFEDWLDDLRSELIITREEYGELCDIDQINTQITKLINLILKNEEDICEKFLDILGKKEGILDEEKQVNEEEIQNEDSTTGISGEEKQQTKEEEMRNKESTTGGILDEEKQVNEEEIQNEDSTTGISGEEKQQTKEEEMRNKESTTGGISGEEQKQIKDEEMEYKDSTTGGEEKQQAKEKEMKIKDSTTGISGEEQQQIKDEEMENKDNTEGEEQQQTKDEEMKNKDSTTGDKRIRFEALLMKMKMESYATSKLSLKNVLEIGSEYLMKMEDLPTENEAWRFLYKLMALNGKARIQSMGFEKDNTGMEVNGGIIWDSQPDTSNLIHPLDIICLLLHFSDNFLKQEIISKMSMCQFAVPLLLPDGDGPDYTFMIWAMRDIVKKWRPQSLTESKGFSEDSLVHICMPTFSFVRLGECNVSKSEILNQILSPGQQYNDFFIHRNMEAGNVPRKISNGLVEIAWYFPAGKGNSDVFSDPVAISNLRGDLESNLKAFTFLSHVSSAIFIIIEQIDQSQYQLLLQNKNENSNYYFIVVSVNERPDQDTQEFLKLLMSGLNVNPNKIILMTKATNKATFVKKIHSTLVSLAQIKSKCPSLETMAQTASTLGICADENSQECQNANKEAKAITDIIHDVVEYKKKTMSLQGGDWKELTKIEKEMCQMKRQGNSNGEHYKSSLRKKCSDIRKHQYKCAVPQGMEHFITALKNKNFVQKCYFLKWIKFYLDLAARSNLTSLQQEYKIKCKNSTKDVLSQLDQRISDSSLGVEHFLRELGQFYEAEYIMVKEKEIHENQRKFIKLPGVAADLLLGGFPLELIDGDASNIPMQWVTDVLTELNNKTGGHCRMRVITVLGVQSTGKSTLLNTMFGLQFPVSSGRCTRGAFMTLINVKENFKQELGCEYILVIDTEGLKAPELASLEDSYEHDNELATFVIGLSDITIINMPMENTAEMKDILQIVVHAFLRMKEIGKKPNCQFVHQNVSDVSAYDKNMRDRKKLLEQLDEMTKTAATMEKKYNITQFSHIMEYNVDKHSWYIPGLWHGVPPMAPVDSGYSETVYELKMFLIQFMKNCSKKSQTIPEFITWMKSLWTAVKHENFIFSFRNSLMAKAYNLLAKTYSDLEWHFIKVMHDWELQTETVIKNLPSDKLEEKEKECTREVLCIAIKEEENILLELENFFEREKDLVSLIERYRADFEYCTKTLRKKLETSSINKCKEAIKIRREEHKIQIIQDKHIESIEKKVCSLLEKCRERTHEIDDLKLEQEFEDMWSNTTSELELSPLPKRDINGEILLTLTTEMRSRGSCVNQKLHNLKHLPGPVNNQPSKKNIFTIAWNFTTNYWRKPKDSSDMDDFAKNVSKACDNYLKGVKKLNTDYDETHCKELLNVINNLCGKNNDRNLQLTAELELDLKLSILGRAANKFQQMHDNFRKKNDLLGRLETLKPKYFDLFKNVFLEKDEIQNRAKLFCQQCLMPAIIDHINQRLGMKIVDAILASGDSKEYSTRTFFQYEILKQLLEENDVNQYVKYSSDYEIFAKEWILKSILSKYKNFHNLQIKTLSNVMKKVRKSLKDTGSLECLSVTDFLKTLTDKLNNELVISQDDMKIVIFENKANIKDFAESIEISLKETQNNIKRQLEAMSTHTVLSKVTVKPEDVLFKKVFGCGKQCPFCKVPCEAGGTDHKEHFASVHRPEALGTYRNLQTQVLCHDICSTSVIGNYSFQNIDTNNKFHPFKEYRTYYPDWAIAPDQSIDASDYWKFVLKEFNENFATIYSAKPAHFPESWKYITKEQALKSLKLVFNMQEDKK